MSVKKLLVLLGTLVLAGALLVACAGEQGPQGELARLRLPRRSVAEEQLLDGFRMLWE